MHRIRNAMANDTFQQDLLFGIVEADETYVGGRPRKGNNHGDDNQPKAKRGRGTSKTPVVGVMERGGRVVAMPFRPGDVNAKGLSRLIKRFVDTAGSLLITDEYRGYHNMSRFIQHATINHQVSYSDGIVHTNNIEGFWSLVKRAWYGQHHHYSKKYVGLYIAEACYKFNNRKNENSFMTTLGLMVAV